MRDTGPSLYRRGTSDRRQRFAGLIEPDLALVSETAGCVSFGFRRKRNLDRVLRLVVVLAFVGVAQAAQAHNLIREDSSPSNWSDPLPIDRPDVSQVYYARLEAIRRQVWFRFRGRAGDRIWFQVGVPVIERLRGLSPRAAVVGPGLPAVSLGFDQPPGLGAVVFEPAAQPREFHEEFRGTSSWIRLEQEYVLPSSGTWYVVAYAVAAASTDDKL